MGEGVYVEGEDGAVVGEELIVEVAGPEEDGGTYYETDDVDEEVLGSLGADAL